MRDLLGAVALITARLRRPLGLAASAPPTSFPSESDLVVIRWLVENSFEAGKREEHRRVASILATPSAADFPKLARDLVVAGVGAEQAVEVTCTRCGRACAPVDIVLPHKRAAPLKRLISSSPKDTRL